MKKFRSWSLQHPYTLAAVLGVVLFALTQAAVLLETLFRFFPLNAENISTVLSTCVQVVTGLYGVTLTGYIFFVGQLDQQADRDRRLARVVDALKRRYNMLILVLTLLCACCFLTGLFWLAFDFAPTASPAARAFLMETFLMMGYCALFNLYFICDVVDPDKFVRTSNTYKAKLDGGDPRLGDAREFTETCEKIKRMSAELIPHDTASFFSTHRARSRITSQLMQDLDKVMNYYSFLAYSTDQTVPEEMCALARSAAAGLEDALTQSRTPQP